MFSFHLLSAQTEVSIFCLSRSLNLFGTLKKKKKQLRGDLRWVPSGLISTSFQVSQCQLYASGSECALLWLASGSGDEDCRSSTLGTAGVFRQQLLWLISLKQNLRIESCLSNISGYILPWYTRTDLS